MQSTFVKTTAVGLDFHSRASRVPSLCKSRGDTFADAVAHIDQTFSLIKVGFIYFFQCAVSANTLRHSVSNLVIDKRGVAYFRIVKTNPEYYAKTKNFAMPLRRVEDLLGPSKGNAEKARQFIADADADNSCHLASKRINEERVLMDAGKIKDLVVSSALLDDMGALFAAIDTDGDNLVILNEFKNFIRGCQQLHGNGGSVITDWEISGVFDLIGHTEPDGNKVIDPAEFSEFFRTSRQQ